MKAMGHTRTIGAGIGQASWPVPAPGVMQRKCACGGSAGMTDTCADCQQKRFLGKSLQAKLQINEPGDHYEQEADRMAERMMRTPEVDVNERSDDVGSPLVQRRPSDGRTAVAEVPPIVQDVLTSPGQPLDAATRAFFEPRFGHDFSQVRVHAGEIAEQSARDVNAHAYTVGHNIVFGAGRFSPDTSEGRGLLAHELTHVMQQTESSVTSGVVQRQPANKTEAYYQKLVKQGEWCRDSEETGARHPGQQCYREIPAPEGYPPGKQMCFSKDTGKFVEASPDIYSPVYGQKPDGTCDIAMKGDLVKLWTHRTRRALGHGAADLLTDPQDIPEFGLWYGRFSGLAMGIALPKFLDSDLLDWAVPSILGYLGGKLGKGGLPRLTRLAEKHGFLPTVSLGVGSNIGLGLGVGLEKRDRPLPLVPINTYLTFSLDSTLAVGGEAGESSTFLAKVGVRIDPGKQGGLFALGSVGAGLALGSDVSAAASVEVGAGLRATDFLDVQLVRESVAGDEQQGATYWLMLKLVAPQRVYKGHRKTPVTKKGHR
jgi:hypothetical protein